MFKRLKRHLVLFNIGVTAVILAVSFATIYMIVRGNVEARALFSSTTSLEYDAKTIEIVNVRIKDERKVALNSLLVTLIVTGLIVEFCVAVFSYVWASDAIRPVKQAYESQKIFIANASHEIKTPLAAIQANLEAADVHGNKFIDNVEQEVRSLASLNQELLNLVRTDVVDSGAKSDTEIKPLIEKVLQNFLPQTDKINFKASIASEEVELVPEDFERLITILIDNALKYCDKTVKIVYKNRTFTIANDGAKIPEDKLPYIFDRFYQTDKSADGVGLGLSIASMLVERNDWRINVESGRETKFSVKL